MGKIAFVFAGQGSQYPGMGKEIYEASEGAKIIFDMADQFRPQTSVQCFSGSKEELSLTVNTQPCLFTVDLSIAEALRERGIKPDGVAGFSLGEIPALTFAGAFETKEEGFQLVIKRAEAMNRSTGQIEGGMLAVLKLTAGAVIGACEQLENVYPVNFNSPVQTVVAGEKKALDRFVQIAKAMGGVVMPLAVSGAFHSPYMAEASKELLTQLERINYRKPDIPVYANINGEPYPADGKQGKERIANQVKSPVQWQKTVEQMVRDDFDIFIEVGPGKTLCGLIRKIVPEAVTYNVENAEDLKKVVDAIMET